MSKVSLAQDSEETPSFENVLDELGMPGRFQLTQIVVIFSTFIMTGHQAMGYIFLGYVPPHVCNSVNVTDLLATYGLQNDSAAGVTYGSCDLTVFTDQDGMKTKVAKIACPDGRNFSDAKHRTWISEWDLVCESKGLAEFSYSMFTIGQILGGIIASYFNDRFGRKMTFIACAIGAFLMEAAIIFAPSIYVIVGIKFVAGFFNKGIVSCGYVYAMEFVAPRHRQTYGVVSGCLWVLYVLITGTIAYILRDFDWHYYQGTMTAFGLSFILSVIFLHESPRWLAANNKTDQAMAVLKKASHQNGKDFSTIKRKFMAYVDYTFSNKTSEALVPLDKNGNGPIEDSVEVNIIQAEKTSFLTLFRNRHLLTTTLITLYIWVTHVFTYYGLYMTSAKLAGDRFLNFTLMILVEIPGYISVLFLLTRFGRRLTISIFLALTGACLLTSTFLFTFGENLPGSEMVATAFFILGKLAISSSFCVTYIITPELFPTNLRSIAAGFCNSVSRVGSMVSPYMGLLFDVVSWGPCVIFTGMCVLGTILVMLLTETKGANLPNTVAEMMEQKKHRKVKQKE